MKDPLGVSPSKWNQGTTRGKEKFLLTSLGIEPTTSGLDLPLLFRGRTEKVGDIRIRVDLIGGRGFDSHRGQKEFFFTSSGSLIPFTSGLFMGLIST